MFDKYTKYGNINTSYMRYFTLRQKATPRRARMNGFLAQDSVPRLNPVKKEATAVRSWSFTTCCILSLFFASLLITPSIFAADQTPDDKFIQGLPGDNINFTAPLEYAADVVTGRIKPWEKDAKKVPKVPLEEKPDQVRVLRKADVDRIAAQAAYEDFAGMRFGKYFSVGQRVEIYQRAKPIDAYILDAKAIRWLGTGGAAPQVRKWDTPAHFRSQIVPLFTRAYGTQFTMDNPTDPSGQVAQIRYTLDYRDTYREYYPKWPHLLWYHWMQNEIMLIHATKIKGCDWYYTLNAGYRYSTIVEKDIGSPVPSNSGYENRHTYIANLALVPNEIFEWFGQFEYYKSKRPRSTFPYSPDHWYYRTELRFRSPDRKTSLIPGMSYSVDYYFPLRNRYEKYEMFCKVGRDFTKRFSATSTFNYALGLRDECDNTAPSYAAPNPIKDSAAWAGVENRVSYNFWNKFYVQAGADFAAGTNMSDFDNWATLLGIEYYKPGVLRANFSWNFNHYYNINDTLNSIGFKIYIFM
ncbi:MAG: hypothetical protein WBC74_01015 [Candidatus Omnitrophota bacterium]